MKDFNICIIGECMLEFSKVEPHLYSQNMGGDSLNTAVYLSRLTPAQCHISYLSALGTDNLSQYMIDTWNDEGINTDLVFRLADKRPGLYLIETDDTGERTFTFWRNDSAAKYWLREVSDEQLVEIFSKFDLVYLSGISLSILSVEYRAKLLNALTRAKAQCPNLKLAFDNNYRKVLWENPSVTQEVYTKVLSISDYAFLTFDDEQSLWGDTEIEQCLARTREFGTSEVIVKCGAEPCLIALNENKQQVSLTKVSATKVEKVVDTTAAGDSFSAGYLSQRIQGADCEASAAFAHRVAGTVIQYKGALTPKEAIATLLK